MLSFFYVSSFTEIFPFLFSFNLSPICSSILLLAAYKFYHSILSLFHFLRKILLAYCYLNNTFYQFFKCFCLWSACVSFSLNKDSKIQLLWMSVCVLQQSQNFYIQLKDTQSMECWNILKSNILHICVIFVHLCVTCNVICNTKVDESMVKKFGNRWKSFASVYVNGWK